MNEFHTNQDSFWILIFAVMKRPGSENLHWRWEGAWPQQSPTPASRQWPGINESSSWTHLCPVIPVSPGLKRWIALVLMCQILGNMGFLEKKWTNEKKWTKMNKICNINLNNLFTIPPGAALFKPRQKICNGLLESGIIRFSSWLPR